MLTAEIIAVGSELLTPEKTDTNSLWLTEKLMNIGIEVKLKTIVGDDEARLEETIRDAMKRSDVVISTGGLGPTEDDVTRPAGSGRRRTRLPFVEGPPRQSSEPPRWRAACRRCSACLVARRTCAAVRRDAVCG